MIDLEHFVGAICHGSGNSFHSLDLEYDVKPLVGMNQFEECQLSNNERCKHACTRLVRVLLEYAYY